MGLGLENPFHILLLLVVVLLVFGAKRLPEVGRGLGHGLREFRGSLAGSQDEPLSASGTRSSSDGEAPADVGRQSK
jgi:sec-independent protein translocase protein TatA